MLNASARFISGHARHDHITPTLANLHWLRVPERIKYKLALLAFRCLHGQAPSYLINRLQRCSNSHTRRSQRLQLVDPDRLEVRRTRLALGERSISIAAARVWNELPSFIKMSGSVVTFRRHLKTYLFCQSF